MKMCELVSVSESKTVQRFQRPSIFNVTPDWYFSSGVRNLFVIVFIAYTTMRVRLCLLNMSSIFEWYVCN